MKRRSPSETPSSPRRKRLLSGEEHALWESVAKSVQPLHKKVRATKADPVDKATAVSMSLEKSSSKSSLQPAAPLRIPRIAAQPTTPPLAPIGRRDRAHLSKGRKEIEARLDLHGMTQARAHRALLAFLHRASADGMTFVLVITGKGTAGEGVLRRQVPEWLSLPEFRGLVVGFEEAHIGHGGTGALYVRVRRAR